MQKFTPEAPTWRYGSLDQQFWWHQLFLTQDKFCFGLVPFDRPTRFRWRKDCSLTHITWCQSSSGRYTYTLRATQTNGKWDGNEGHLVLKQRSPAHQPQEYIGLTLQSHHLQVYLFVFISLIPWRHLHSVQWLTFCQPLCALQAMTWILLQ